MKLQLTAISLLLALSGLAQAQTKDSGFYIGASLGTTKSSIKIDGEKLDDDKDKLYGIYGGYKFTPNFALEGRLLSLGKYKDDDVSSETGAITINAVGLIPLGAGNWELMGQIGLGYSSNEIKTGSDKDKEKEGLGTIGVGVRWTPAPAFTLQLAADYYGIQDATATSEDVKVKNSVTALALSGQFNF